MAEPVSQNQYISVFGRTTGMNGDNFDPIEFEGNGIAVLNPSKCTIIETLNGGYNLTLTHPTDSDNAWKTLYPLNFIKSQGQIFRIQSVETSYDGSSSGNVSVYAEHATYMMNDAWIPHGSIVHGEGMEYFLYSARAASRPNGEDGFGSSDKRFPNFTYSANISFPDEYKTVQLDDFLNLQYVHDIGEGKTRYQVIMEAIQKFGGELYRDNFYFSIYKRMENSLGGDGKLDAFDIRLGENMLGIKRKVDISNFCSYFQGYLDDGDFLGFSYGDMDGFMNNIIREKHYSGDNHRTLSHEIHTYWSQHMSPEFTYTLKLKDLRQNPDFKLLSGVRFKVGDIGRIVDERLGLSNNLRLEITQTKTNGITGEVEEITLKSISAFEWDYGSVKLPEFPDIPEPPEPPQPEYDETKISVIRLDENMQETDDIYYASSLQNANDFMNNKSNFYNVYIGDQCGVASIPDSTFDYRKNMVKIKLPKALTLIGKTAFNGCEALVSINIPDTVTAIGEHTFYKCSFTSIVLPEGLTEISKNLFLSTKLTSIKIPDTVTAIYEYAFQSCTDLQSVVFSKNLKYILTGAFWNCPKLTKIEIPSTISRIVNTAFNNCPNITEIVIDKPENSISGAPWGATNATVTWTG